MPMNLSSDRRGMGCDWGNNRWTVRARGSDLSRVMSRDEPWADCSHGACQFSPTREPWERYVREMSPKLILCAEERQLGSVCVASLSVVLRKRCFLLR